VLDLRSSLFWLLLSIAVITESLRMGIGTFQNPGMGFMSFWAGGFLAILSFVLFLRTIRNKRRGRIDFHEQSRGSLSSEHGEREGEAPSALLMEGATRAPVNEAALAGAWRKKVLFVLTALVAYAVIMPVAGYLISTFLLMTFLYWFADPSGKKWFVWCLVLSFVTTAISYYVFSVLLNCQFPAGVLGI
jgi:hypothetical protein